MQLRTMWQRLLQQTRKRHDPQAKSSPRRQTLHGVPRLEALEERMVLSAPTFTFTTINEPNAVFGTQVTAINNAGQLVGSYVDEFGTTHGFLLSNGVYRTIDDPRGIATIPLGINNHGMVSGYYFDARGVEHGFLYSIANGQFVTFDDSKGTRGNYADGINDKGNVTGGYLDGNFVAHGYKTSGQSFGTNDNPHAGNKAFEGTYAHATNANNTTVGTFVSPGTFFFQSYVQNQNQYTTINVPGAFETFADGISNTGEIAGNYLAENGVHGFVNINGTYYNVDDPNAGEGGTVAYSLNDFGQVVGFYVDGEGFEHGFVATPDPAIAGAPVINAGTGQTTPVPASSGINVAAVDHLLAQYASQAGLMAPPHS